MECKLDYNRGMRSRVLPMLLIISVVVIMVFGFFMIGFSANGQCPIALMTGGQCPSSGNILASAAHYMSGLQFLTHYIISASVFLSTLPFLLAIFILLSSFTALERTTSLNDFSYRSFFLFREKLLLLKRKLLHWFALHYGKYLSAPHRVHDTYLVRNSLSFGVT